MMKFIISEAVLPDSKSLFMKFAPLLEAMLEMENISLMMEDVEDFAKNYEALLTQSQKLLSSRPSEALEQHRFVLACTYFARQVHAAIPESPKSMVDIYELEEQINQCLDTAQAVNLAGLLSVLEFADRARKLLERDTHGFFTDLFKRRGVPEYFQINEVEGIEWFNQERMDNFIKYLSALYPQELSAPEASRIMRSVRVSNFKLNAFLAHLSKS